MSDSKDPGPAGPLSEAMGAGERGRLHRTAVISWLVLTVLALGACIIAIETPAPCCGDGSLTSFAGTVAFFVVFLPTLFILIWLTGDSPWASLGAGVYGLAFALLAVTLFLGPFATLGQPGYPTPDPLALLAGLAYGFGGVAAAKSRTRKTTS